jgi:NADH:ubiquinone oxidoreductase subunit 6 (subunit J)
MFPLFPADVTGAAQLLIYLVSVTAAFLSVLMSTR